MANFVTNLITRMYGTYVGADTLGNRYFQHRKLTADGKRKRWVVYKNFDEASCVPPQYHGWLHYTHDEFPDSSKQHLYDWQIDHKPNLSGTKYSYKPKGHSDHVDGKRQAATGDYIAWRP